MKEEIKVGFFVLAGIVFLATAIFLLGDFSFKKHYNIDVVFKEVAGLADKSNVRLNGVEVGKVKKVYIDQDKVVVKISIESGVIIYKNSKFSIGSTSIIGSKFLQIDQGSADSGVLANGEIVYGENSLSMEKAITQAIGNLENFMSSVNKNGEFGKNLNDVVLNVKNLTATLNEMISVSQPHIENSMARMEDVLNNLKSLTDRLDKLTDKIDKGEGTIGALISDKNTKEDVKAAISNIKDSTDSLRKYLNKTSKIRTYWMWDTRYEPVSEYNMNSVGVKLYTSENKYYYAGISNFFNIKNQDRGITYEEKNRVDAYMGWEWKKADFYIGALMSNAGAGIIYRPFYYDHILGKFSFLFEGNDFARNRVIKGRKFNNPRYDVGLNYKVNSNLETGIRVSDIVEVKRFSYSAKILFEDKDLAYLFGFLGGSGSAMAIK
jgi:phospholipid/cholesterol/gamma-HCH transport system substrate-binding protein